MEKIDELLMFLLDGSWHAIDEAAKSIRTSQENVKMIAELLEEFDIIQIERRNLRITCDTKKFWEAILTES